MRVGVDAIHVAAGGSGSDNGGDAPVAIYTCDGAAVSVIDVNDVVIVVGVVVGIVSAGVVAVAAAAGCGFEGGEKVLGGGFAAHRRAEGGRLGI